MIWAVSILGFFGVCALFLISGSIDNLAKAIKGQGPVTVTLEQQSDGTYRTTH